MSRIGKFISDTRAGATAVAATVIIIMSILGTTIVTDSLWLYDQRDVLKAASDAGTIAATRHMSKLLTDNPDITDATLDTELAAIARRYVVLNLQHLPAERLRTALGTLVITVTPNRSTRTLSLDVQAELGGTLLAHNFLPDAQISNGGVRIASGAIQQRVPAEVVLAFDTSYSMAQSVDGRWGVPEEESRMGVVKRSARNLVEQLDPSPEHHIAIGLVPWSYTVRLDDTMQTRWADNNWTRYPSTRVYPQPYQVVRGAAPASITQTLPAAPPDGWLGCLDEYRVVTTSHAEWPPVASLLDTPSALPFAQYYFPSLRNYSYDCLTSPLPPGFSTQFCYTEAHAGRGQTVRQPQYACGTTGATMLPLTSERDTINEEIETLRAVGIGTYSTLGVLWAQRMLSPAWRGVWGDPVHPLDHDGVVRKVIVLLTDGEDLYCGSQSGACLESELGIERTEACTLAKAQGIEVFVIAAMAPENITGGMAQSLRDCSSESDYPDQTFAYLDNPDAESLRQAFNEIGHRLHELRRVH